MGRHDPGPIPWWLASLVLSLLFLPLAGFGGQTVLFSDDCSGPALNPRWEAFLPETSLGGDRSPAAAFLGAPSFEFTQLKGTPVLRLTNTLGRYQRRGWSSSDSFQAAGFRYEVRFNTLHQSAQTSIDAFIEIWLLDAGSPKRRDLLSPFGGNFSADRLLFCGSSIDEAYSQQPFAYRNDTWYRLVLEGVPGRKIRASVCSDTGRELIGQDLGHGADAFKCGFKIALSQAMGDPFTGRAPVQVAIAWIKLTEI